MTHSRFIHISFKTQHTLAMQLKYALTTLAIAAPALAAGTRAPRVPGKRIYPAALDKRANNGDAQSSLTLLSSLVMPALAFTGQEDPTAGQVDSLTSSNNFINYCAQFPTIPLTNGEQIFEGSCNPVPMGMVIAKALIPQQRVLNPKNGDVVPEGQDINFQIAVANIQTGSFTNAQLTYYSAPAQVNAQGVLIGHSHITVQAIASLDDTTLSDNSKFAFFKGLNDAAVNGVLSATAVGGLPAGFYRACTLGASSNHTPVIPSIAQRGSENDCIRFTVQAGAGGAAAASSTPAATSTAASTGATGKTGKGKGKTGKRTSNLPSRAAGSRREFSAGGRSRIARSD